MIKPKTLKKASMIKMLILLFFLAIVEFVFSDEKYDNYLYCFIALGVPSICIYHADLQYISYHVSNLSKSPGSYLHIITENYYLNERMMQQFLWGISHYLQALG